MSQFNQIITETGMPVTPEKTLGPTQYLPYLGLALDFLCQLLAIPEEKEGEMLCTSKRALGNLQKSKENHG